MGLITLQIIKPYYHLSLLCSRAQVLTSKYLLLNNES